MKDENKRQLFIKKYPIYTCLILFLLNMVFRINDIFILRLDEVWGEIALSKTMGIFIIIGFLFLYKINFKDIGLSYKDFSKNIFYGLGLIMTAFIFAYIFELLYLKYNSYSPKLYFSAINNSLHGIGENDGLIFGLWHIVWPIKYVLSGSMSVRNAAVFALGYILLSGLIGFTFGLLYIKTNSLWGPFFAHTFNNTVLNLIHVRTKSGINKFLSIRVLLITITLLILVLLTKDHFYFKNESSGIVKMKL